MVAVARSAHATEHAAPSAGELVVQPMTRQGAWGRHAPTPTCPKCERRFASNQSLSRHVARGVECGRMPRCDRCDHRFKSNAGLARHQKTCGGPRPTASQEISALRTALSVALSLTLVTTSVAPRRLGEETWAGRVDSLAPFSGPDALMRFAAQVRSENRNVLRPCARPSEILLVFGSDGAWTAVLGADAVEAKLTAALGRDARHLNRLIEDALDRGPDGDPGVESMRAYRADYLTRAVFSALVASKGCPALRTQLLGTYRELLPEYFFVADV